MTDNIVRIALFFTVFDILMILPCLAEDNPQKLPTRKTQITMAEQNIGCPGTCLKNEYLAASRNGKNCICVVCSPICHPTTPNCENHCSDYLAVIKERPHLAQTKEVSMSLNATIPNDERSNHGTSINYPSDTVTGLPSIPNTYNCSFNLRNSTLIGVIALQTCIIIGILIVAIYFYCKSKKFEKAGEIDKSRVPHIPEENINSSVPLLEKHFNTSEIQNSALKTGTNTATPVMTTGDSGLSLNRSIGAESNELSLPDCSVQSQNVLQTNTNTNLNNFVQCNIPPQVSTVAQSNTLSSLNTLSNLNKDAHRSPFGQPPPTESCNNFRGVHTYKSRQVLDAQRKAHNSWIYNTPPKTNDYKNPYHQLQSTEPHHILDTTPKLRKKCVVEPYAQAQSTNFDESYLNMSDGETDQEPLHALGDVSTGYNHDLDSNNGNTDVKQRVTVDSQTTPHKMIEKHDSLDLTENASDIPDIISVGGICGVHSTANSHVSSAPRERSLAECLQPHSTPSVDSNVRSRNYRSSLSVAGNPVFNTARDGQSVESALSNLSNPTDIDSFDVDGASGIHSTGRSHISCKTRDRSLHDPAYPSSYEATGDSCDTTNLTGPENQLGVGDKAYDDLVFPGIIEDNNLGTCNLPDTSRTHDLNVHAVERVQTQLPSYNPTENSELGIISNTYSPIQEGSSQFTPLVEISNKENVPTQRSDDMEETPTQRSDDMEET